MRQSEKCAHYFNFLLIIGLALLVNCQSQNTQFNLSFIGSTIFQFRIAEEKKSMRWTRYWQCRLATRKNRAIINRASCRRQTGQQQLELGLHLKEH